MPSLPHNVNFSTFAPGNQFATAGSLTTLADGNFLAVWAEMSNEAVGYLYTQIFRPDGSVLRGKALFQTAADVGYSAPVAVTLADGRTVVAWSKSGSAGKFVEGQILDIAHNPSGTVIRISDESVENATPVSIKALTNGGFSVLYDGATDEGPGHYEGIVTAPSGTWAQEGFFIHDSPDSDRIATAGIADGSIVAVLANAGETQTPIIALIYDPITETQGPNIDLGIVDSIAPINPGICSLGNNQFVAVWEDAEAGAAVMRAQAFNGDGTLVGGPILFSKPAGEIQGQPDIEPLAGGGFALVFQARLNGDDNTYVAAAKADGTILQDTISVGTTTAGDQYNPSIMPLANGNFVVGWTNTGEAGFAFMTEYFGPGGVTTPPPDPGTGTGDGGTGTGTGTKAWTATPGHDAHTGTAADEIFDGLGGNDTLDGGAGNDTVIGGTGNDNLSGGLGNDKLVGGLGKDTLDGGAGNDVFLFDTAVAKKKNANIDKVLAFSPKDDTMQLENKIFTKLKAGTLKKDAFYIGTKAHDPSDRVIFDSKSGKLFFDMDGNGAQQQIQIAQLDKKIKGMSYKDFYIV